MVINMQIQAFGGALIVRLIVTECCDVVLGGWSMCVLGDVYKSRRLLPSTALHPRNFRRSKQRKEIADAFLKYKRHLAYRLSPSLQLQYSARHICISRHEQQVAKSATTGAIGTTYCRLLRLGRSNMYLNLIFPFTDAHLRKLARLKTDDR
jgi:hypothetical protein